jgi:hypothetical protein
MLPPHFLVYVEQQKAYIFLFVFLESIASWRTASVYRSMSNNRIESGTDGEISNL